MLKKSLLGISLFLIIFSSSAQQRIIEESLVYSDPTVTKVGQWGGGISLDLLNYRGPVSVTDTGGNLYSATQVSNTLGFSGFVGYDDYSVLLSYRPGYSSTYVPGFNDYMWSRSAQYDLVFRWLLTDYRTKYFVPYVMGGYLKYDNTDTVSVVYNGVQEVNTQSAKGPEIGLGGIFPLNGKFGFRADVKVAFVKIDNNSNLFQQFAGSSNAQYYQGTITGYYNLTDKINLQTGLQYIYVTNVPTTGTTGIYLQLGTRF